MTSGEIDSLCTDWLKDNYGEELARKYMPYTLVVPIWNHPDLNDALETLRQVLCIASGADESFGTTDYYEARRKLRLLDNRVEIPEVFIRAFTGPPVEGEEPIIAGRQLKGCCSSLVLWSRDRLEKQE